MQAPIPIPRIHRAEFATFRERNPGPVVLTDALDEWWGQGHWSPDHLAHRLRDTWVMLAASRQHQFNYNVEAASDTEKKAFAGEVMSFEEARAAICDPHATQHYYLMQRSIPEEFPILMGDLRVPAWVPVDQPVVNLWFGSAGNVTPLHYDVTNNFFAQVYGSKKMTLFSPYDTTHLYPYPYASKMRHISFVDVEAPDLTRFPRAAAAQPYEVELKAGELLWMPAFWWHHVRGMSVSISVNFWWEPTMAETLVPNALRELPEAYEADRLLGLQSAELTPLGLDFSTASVLLYEARCFRAAVVMAGAALYHRLAPDAALGTPTEDTTLAQRIDAARQAGRLPDADRLTFFATVLDRILAEPAFVPDAATVAAMVGAVEPVH